MTVVDLKRRYKQAVRDLHQFHFGQRKSGFKTVAQYEALVGNMHHHKTVWQIAKREGLAAAMLYKLTWGGK